MIQILIYLNPADLAIVCQCCSLLNTLTEKAVKLILQTISPEVMSRAMLRDVLQSNRGQSLKVYAKVTKPIIFTMGGAFSSQSIFEYSLLDNTWASKSDLPTAREDFEIIVSNIGLLAISGQDDVSTTSLDVYDYVQDEWLNPCALPVGLCRLAAVVVRGSLLIIGGEKTGANTNIATVYTITLDEVETVARSKIDSNCLSESTKPCWDEESIPSLTYARRGHAAVVYRNELWVAGGIITNAGTDEVSSSVEILSLGASGIDFYDNAWSEGPNLVSPKSNFSLVVSNEKLYAVGGDDEGTIEMFDDEINEWKVVSTFPSYRKNFSVTLVERKNPTVPKGTTVLSDCEDYSKELSKLFASNLSLENLAALEEDEQNSSLIYVFGGQSRRGQNLSTWEEFDLTNGQVSNFS